MWHIHWDMLSTSTLRADVWGTAAIHVCLQQNIYLQPAPTAPAAYRLPLALCFTSCLSLPFRILRGSDPNDYLDEAASTASSNWILLDLIRNEHVPIVIAKIMQKNPWNSKWDRRTTETLTWFDPPSSFGSNRWTDSEQSQSRNTESISSN